jgi:quinol monooxygenase YgiN
LARVGAAERADASEAGTGFAGPERGRRATQRAEKLMPPNRIGPIVRIAELEIDPNQIAAYHALLVEEVEASVRIEPGVLFFYALAIKGSPDQVRVIEAYADHAAYEAHLTTPHFLKYKTHAAGMVRSLRLLETEPINLQAKGRIQTDPSPPCELVGSPQGLV